MLDFRRLIKSINSSLASLIMSMIESAHVNAREPPFAL